MRDFDSDQDLLDMVLYSAANDPRPQMIPRPEMILKLDRKWSPMWTTNDPAGKRGMAWSVVFRGFFLFFNFVMFIYFHHLNDELDKNKENIFWQRKL